MNRELTEDEVCRINLILKRRADRYIAATNQEWLYPEQTASVTHWSNIDHDWFLLPNPWKVGFKGSFVAGYGDGTSWAIDEYGRTPDHPDFESRVQRDKELKQHQRAKLKWALKRQGCSIADNNSDIYQNIADKLMHDAIREHQEREQTRRKQGRSRKHRNR